MRVAAYMPAHQWSDPNLSQSLPNLPANLPIDIETCLQGGGRLRVIASIEAPAVIARILVHLGQDAGSVDPARPSRAPPQGDRLV